jgi:hypothetical protein
MGEELRIRVSIHVDQPLVRGVRICESDVRGVCIGESDDQVIRSWFDTKYEKVPYFCFDWACLSIPRTRV